MNDNKVSRGGNASTKIILAVIILSVLLSVVAVLVWVKILETQDAMSNDANATRTTTVTNNGNSPVSGANSADKVESGAETVAEAKVVEVPETPVQEVSATEEPSSAEENPIMSIDDALSALESSASASSGNTNYLSSSDYGKADADEADLSEQSVEMKKPTIAQNLQLSRQSSFSKDMVKYQEYTIQAGDTLNTIAEHFGLSLQTIVSVNQITSAASLWIGSALQIPDRDGSLYIVKEGDTLLSITQQYGLAMNAKTLGEVNGLMDDKLVVGQKIFIPYETMEASGTLTASSDVDFDMPAENATTVGIYNQKVVNPVNDNSMQLDGILLQAADGTPVCASEAGTVIDKGFNENGSGFVKLMHSNGYTTYYDYLANILVETTDKVEKGQQIGSFGEGMTNTAVPVVFFQIKQGGIPFDPESFFD
ncbi:MAG: LysM peptidoglycan-binding domain-containing protein [Spirochaetales bacterium]|nr:LysM peptidoglycan-binding domain-containing protein [Spirochaetales bacterium]